MDFFGLLTMLGGLALFLYGMNTMGDGLAKMAGSRLEQILEKLTSTPIRAVLLGAGVTAVIQSSSATTVMVVGFVNSGIMKLSQAVGIIMGANVGTSLPPGTVCPGAGIWPVTVSPVPEKRACKSMLFSLLFVSFSVKFRKSGTTIFFPATSSSEKLRDTPR